MQAEKEHESADGAGDAKPEKKVGGKKIIIIAVAALLLAGGAVAGLFLTGKIGGKHEAEVKHEETPTEEQKAQTPSVFLNLPDMIVNINTDSKRPVFLKISTSIELGSPEDVKAVEALLPRVVDNFQIYIRELRMEDLKGSAGMYRLREELLMRVSQAVAPVKVRDILFREILLQ